MYQREFERKARIGLVGVGSHAYRNLLPALHFLPAELVAMTSRGQEKLQKTSSWKSPRPCGPPRWRK